ncbi:hypothetical protein GGS26DRAFT_334626 [Hypomontagnella submonticulosa]|nr:hypothetical protein GGS26DRAFT_334626 [Hypomontagnella submonticulosa]
MVVFNKALFVLGILPWPALGMTKVSVLLMYKRIFTTPRFRIVVWILVGVNTAWSIAFPFAMTFSCTPVEAQSFFELPYSQYTCVNLVALFATALATGVATDCKYTEHVFSLLRRKEYSLMHYCSSSARPTDLQNMAVADALHAKGHDRPPSSQTITFARANAPRVEKRNRSHWAIRSCLRGRGALWVRGRV